ncbi:response regulator [Streptomyces sp. NPDC001984]
MPDTTAAMNRPHVWRPGSSVPPLLLLHGTGDDEHGLVPLGEDLAPGSALLSPRGTVLEGTMPRFFRRLREGVFDEDDLRERADEMPKLPVLMLTAHDAVEHRIDGLEAGADDYVTKPFSVEEVVLQLRGLWRGAHGIRERLAGCPNRPPDSDH